jgi:NAD(P)-dependent dehydrogenase (short-subunit alcohol dehydrogenase family)
MKTKTYVITGATSGIGKLLVEVLSKENIVFAGYRSEENGKLLGTISPNIYPFYVDYAKPDTVKSAADYIVSKCGRIDTLINVAGCVVAGPIEQIQINEIRRQFDVNVFGHLELAQRLVELLEDGKIINVSSMSSFGIFPFIAPYSASKRCLDMFFNSFLLESKRNIKVVSIKPGVIATPLWGKSVDENTKQLGTCEGYEKEMGFVLSNAQKNGQKGLSPQKVVDVILKVDSLNNPKLSYTVGRDAFVANLVSKLPQSISNKFVRLGLKLRIKKNEN